MKQICCKEIARSIILWLCSQLWKDHECTSSISSQEKGLSLYKLGVSSVSDITKMWGRMFFFFQFQNCRTAYFTADLQWPNSPYSPPDSREHSAVEQGSSSSVERGLDSSRFVYTHTRGPEGPTGLRGSRSVPHWLRLCVCVCLPPFMLECKQIPLLIISRLGWSALHLSPASEPGALLEDEAEPMLRRAVKEDAHTHTRRLIISS